MISIRSILIGLLSFAAYRLVWELIRGDDLVTHIADRTREEVTA